MPFQVVAAIDINTTANQIYRHNFPDTTHWNKTIEVGDSGELRQDCLHLNKTVIQTSLYFSLSFALDSNRELPCLYAKRGPCLSVVFIRKNCVLTIRGADDYSYNDDDYYSKNYTPEGVQ